MPDLSTVQSLISRGKQRHPELASRLERALVIVIGQLDDQASNDRQRNDRQGEIK